MRYRSYLLIFWLLLVTVTACQKDSPPVADRYVVISPEIAEIISALGASDRIVGISAECNFSEEMQGKEIVGNFGAINMEKVLALAPDIVFTSALEQESIAYDLRKLGLHVESSYPKSLDEMLKEIVRIGGIIDLEKEAHLLADSLSKEIAKIKATSAGLSRPRVYLEIYRDPIMSVSDNSFVGELIETAGGDNIFENLERDYSRVKAEDVIQMMPDIMICYSHDSLQNILARKGWSRIPAISNQMIFFEEDIDPDLIQRAGPRCIDGMHRLAELYEIWRNTQ